MSLCCVFLRGLVAAPSSSTKRPRAAAKPKLRHLVREYAMDCSDDDLFDSTPVKKKAKANGATSAAHVRTHQHHLPSGPVVSAGDASAIHLSDRPLHQAPSHRPHETGNHLTLVPMSAASQDSLLSLSFLQDEVFDDDEPGRREETNQRTITSAVNDQYLNRVINQVSHRLS